MNYPAWYICDRCNACGVRLWREFGISQPDLLCVDCAQRNQVATFPSQRGLHIGHLVPAVPLPDGSGYWTYEGIPRQDLVQWEALPLR